MTARRGATISGRDRPPPSDTYRVPLGVFSVDKLPAHESAHRPADRSADAADGHPAQLWAGHYRLHHPGARRTRAAQPAPAPLRQEAVGPGPEDQAIAAAIQGRPRGADQGADGPLQGSGRQPGRWLPTAADPDARPLRSVLRVST